MSKSLRILLCCLLPMAMVAAPPLRADRNNGLTLEQAAGMVRKQTGGTILAAEPRTVDGKLMYRIKVLTEQRHVRSIWIDPAAKGKKKR